MRRSKHPQESACCMCWHSEHQLIGQASCRRGGFNGRSFQTEIRTGFKPDSTPAVPESTSLGVDTFDSAHNPLRRVAARLDSRRCGAETYPLRSLIGRGDSLGKSEVQITWTNANDGQQFARARSEVAPVAHIAQRPELTHTHSQWCGKSCPSRQGPVFVTFFVFP